jgi:hypothetical protein
MGSVPVIYVFCRLDSECATKIYPRPSAFIIAAWIADVWGEACGKAENLKR